MVDGVAMSASNSYEITMKKKAFRKRRFKFHWGSSGIVEKARAKTQYHEPFCAQKDRLQTRRVAAGGTSVGFEFVV
jgi:hypothetical protein